MTTTPQPQVDIEELESVAYEANCFDWDTAASKVAELATLHPSLDNFIAAANPSAVLALIAETRALRAVKQELADWKAMMRRFVPSNREPDRCRNCERLFIDHYGGPFAEPNTAYCSKQAVPTAPLPAPPEAP